MANAKDKRRLPTICTNYVVNIKKWQMKNQQ